MASANSGSGGGTANERSFGEKFENFVYGEPGTKTRELNDRIQEAVGGAGKEFAEKGCVNLGGICLAIGPGSIGKVGRPRKAW